ncbi:MvdC/MvdD family ATP grasp protein [Streptomyces sp. NPDC127091]|uniref:MvdC/MvdD family ATP grasp protein n=1 Tax=Streptomyces sp. NPDC127091 TaxID=3347134 RepID=UPI0036558031
MTDTSPVLVVTNLDDPTTDLVIDELHRRSVPVVRFDSGDFPTTLSFPATLTAHGIEGTLTTPTPTRTRTADLSRVRSLYYRRPSGFTFPHLDGQTERFALTQARYGLGGVMASLPGCRYVNHPHRIGEAEFKPAGLAAAAACGFRLPPTTITSCPVAARAFAETHGPVIYKPLSTPLYRIDGVSCTVEVREVTADEIDDTVTGTAHLFQQRIDKTGDVRVTVIGDRVFCPRAGRQESEGRGGPGAGLPARDRSAARPSRSDRLRHQAPADGRGARGAEPAPARVSEEAALRALGIGGGVLVR